MIAGKWDITIKAPIGDLKSVMDLKVEGETLTGEFIDENGERSAITDGTVNGEQFLCKVKLKTSMGAIQFKVDGVVDGDNISGNAKMAMAKSSFTGKRSI